MEGVRRRRLRGGIHGGGEGGRGGGHIPKFFDRLHNIITAVNHMQQMQYIVIWDNVSFYRSALVQNCIAIWEMQASRQPSCGEQLTTQVKHWMILNLMDLGQDIPQAHLRGPIS
ncbi:unnamed protein product [Pleuronectes platessa]|uniref:Uncharacterized protein n=1 Tax=Pleuronectes platessa TaxID=8262 RepID=A0A9N7V242_PLEPL|nr:unnamed protein product [Pleuronectes platessa]